MNIFDILTKLRGNLSGFPSTLKTKLGFNKLSTEFKYKTVGGAVLFTSGAYLAYANQNFFQDKKYINYEFSWLSEEFQKRFAYSIKLMKEQASLETERVQTDTEEEFSLHLSPDVEKRLSELKNENKKELMEAYANLERIKNLLKMVKDSYWIDAAEQKFFPQYGKSIVDKINALKLNYKNLIESLYINEMLNTASEHWFRSNHTLCLEWCDQVEKRLALANREKIFKEHYYDMYIRWGELKGSSLFFLKRHEESESILLEVLEKAVNADMPAEKIKGILHNLAYLNMQDGNLHITEEIYKTLYFVCPDYDVALQNYAEVSWQMGHLEDASKYIREAVHLSPESIDLRLLDFAIQIDKDIELKSFVGSDAKRNTLEKLFKANSHLLTDKNRVRFVLLKDFLNSNRDTLNPLTRISRMVTSSMLKNPLKPEIKTNDEKKLKPVSQRLQILLNKIHYPGDVFEEQIEYNKVINTNTVTLTI